MEDESITIERETALHHRSDIKPSRHHMAEGGWMVHDGENDSAQCPHCHMQYSKWKSDDDPLLIHRHLSPLCPFVLSTNPLNSRSIPVRETREQFTDEFINAAKSQSYAGLVPTEHDPNSSIAHRQASFQTFPYRNSINTDALAISGFYYISRQRSIQCFYCKRMISVVNQMPWFVYYSRLSHASSGCFYAQQLNDRAPALLTPPSKNSSIKSRN